MQTKQLKVAIIQRRCPHYRIPLFKKLNESDNISLTVIVNDPEMKDLTEADLGFELLYIPALPIQFGYGSKTYQIPICPLIIFHLRKAKYDVVITEGVTNIINNLLIYPTVRWMNGRYVWWGAGRRRFAPKTLFRRLADPFVHYIIRHADACIAYGTVARDYMISVGATPEKVSIAQNTMDTSSIINQQLDYSAQIKTIRQHLNLTTEQVILYVGVIEKRKKVENLILAYDHLCKQQGGLATLLIVGGGPHLQTLQNWTQNKFPGLNIHFLGKVIDGVEPYFAMCDVFVLPSEGGLALNQAMAFGKPVIATSADGTEIDLIQHGKNGLLVVEDNIPSLSKAIMDVLYESTKQRKMGKMSAQLMEEVFTLTNMVKGFICAIDMSFN